MRDWWTGFPPTNLHHAPARGDPQENGQKSAQKEDLVRYVVRDVLRDVLRCFLGIPLGLLVGILRGALVTAEDVVPAVRDQMHQNDPNRRNFDSEINKKYGLETNSTKKSKLLELKKPYIQKSQNHPQIK